MERDGLMPLWQPSEEAITHSRTERFRQSVNVRHHLNLQNYEELFDWSTGHIGDFWSDVWDETGIIGEKGTHVVDQGALPVDNPQWFKDAKLNWAENMLRCRDADKIALIEMSTSYHRLPVLMERQFQTIVEPHPTNLTPQRRSVTYRALYDLVADVVSGLLTEGVKPGDRVASYSSNCIVNALLGLLCSTLF
jgi:acetoacetyl-CoA synthetase